MTEINKRLLQLILEGASTNEILKTLNITPKQLKIRLESLKKDGYGFEYQVTDSGLVTYSPLNGMYHDATNSLQMNLTKQEKEFTFLTFSDLHIGHKLDNINNLYLLYEYAKKEGINIIINCGDIIEGCCNNESEKTIRKQLEKLISNHPFDEEILNIVLFGNHDYTPLEQYNINISNVITAERSDFISLGFETGLINILNGQIIISHPVKRSTCSPNHRFPNQWSTGKLILKGHGHHNSIKTVPESCTLKVPTASNVIYSQNPSLPGAMKITVHFNEEGYLKIIHVENLVITDRIYTAGYFKQTIKSHAETLTEQNVLSKKLKRTT